jgi:hypothetical protein
MQADSAITGKCRSRRFMSLAPQMLSGPQYV